ncbi:hypothetical protein AVEN_191995-1 [Araneus ventricosus]|uniref:Uncharacterized protein n=1 Tax=Araneus ventricosus TaxID=182803 RepID=A0A4Y2U4U8_ARAVE|nr:hypothetical protein AVEN_191995-1 [Araneus ventricosus]
MSSSKTRSTMSVSSPYPSCALPMQAAAACIHVRVLAAVHTLNPCLHYPRQGRILHRTPAESFSSSRAGRLFRMPPPVASKPPP